MPELCNRQVGGPARHQHVPSLVCGFAERPQGMPSEMLIGIPPPGLVAKHAFLSCVHITTAGHLVGLPGNTGNSAMVRGTSLTLHPVKQGRSSADVIR